jgi:hypothetical protein
MAMIYLSLKNRSNMESIPEPGLRTITEREAGMSVTQAPEINLTPFALQ